MICNLPPNFKQLATDIIAVFIYLPFALSARILHDLGANTRSYPLSYYRNTSFYTMRTDARDRFGTPLEKRLTREQILFMCKKAGLIDLKFSNTPPYWCVVGKKGKNNNL